MASRADDAGFVSFTASPGLGSRPTVYGLPVCQRQRPHIPIARVVGVRACAAGSNGNNGTNGTGQNGYSNGNGTNGSASASSESSTPDDAVQRIAALEEKLSGVAHAAALRDDLLGRVADAVSHALTSDAADALQVAVETAADARAKADALNRRLTGTKQRAHEAITKYAQDLENAHGKVSSLENRVRFLSSSVAEKDRLLELKARSTKDPAAEDGLDGCDELSTRLECPADAKASLASLLLYPSVSSPEKPLGATAARASSKTRLDVPSFLHALQDYLNILTQCTSADDADGPLQIAPAAIAAYSELWRSVSAPGRRGWRGEILHVALTGADPDLIASAHVSPDFRRALAADLRALQALYNTPTSDVAAWLCAGVGVPRAPVALPEENVSPDVGLDRGAIRASREETDLSSAEEHAAKLESILKNARDWGADDVVMEVLYFATDGPSHASSLADRYYGLRWDASSGLEGILSVKDVDKLPAYHFVGVEDIRERLCENCEFLLHGLTSSNVHMYGSPGSGKSSCVMSLLKDFGPRGLRIIEVTKETLGYLPDIFEVIVKLPQKFIIFIDDLTFDEHESEEMRLAKAALEGSLRVNPSNAFVLCTSNRRFPVGSRLTDATEEKLAFSYRFGIVLAFPRTTREAYLAIVHALAAERKIIMEEKEMDDFALAWALGQDGNANSLSGRTARQFVDYVASCQALDGIVEGKNYLASAGNKHASAVPANSHWQTENIARPQL